MVTQQQKTEAGRGEKIIINFIGLINDVAMVTHDFNKLHRFLFNMNTLVIKIYTWPIVTGFVLAYEQFLLLTIQIKEWLKR